MARLAEKQALGVILNKYTCNATSRTPVPYPPSRTPWSHIGCSSASAIRPLWPDATGRGQRDRS